MTRNGFAAGCAVLFVLWVNGWLWWAVAGAAAVYLVWSTYKRLEAKQAADAAVALRADVQHRQALKGDPHGVYGAGAEVMEEFTRTTQ